MKIWNCFLLLQLQFIVGYTLANSSNKSSFVQLLNKRRIKRSQELNLSPESICDRFTNPITSNKTFFSPNNGGDVYPSNVDCILILEAPDDHVIQLDFRNNFNIELSSNCEYDFLEVRDGKYGFSDTLGRFCGNQFPSIISSSDKYLWLYFHSDESIEYIGFEGVYNFTARPPNAARKMECFITMNNTVEGMITQDDIDKEIKLAVVTESIPLDCIWMIEVEPEWQIAMSFEKFDLINKNDCINNFIDVYGNDTNVSNPLKHFCAVVAEPFESKTNRLHIRFYANKETINSTFSIYYSTFRKKRGSCEANELDCEDDTCIIREGLRCNDRPNCKFQKDEENCPKEADDKNNDLLFIIIVFSSLLGAMTSVFFFNCIRKLIRDQKIIREHIAQSKESKLDEAGRSSMKRSLENVNRIAPRSTGGYTTEAKTIQIHDEDVGQMFHELDTASISHSLGRSKRSQYSYREQLKNILRNSPAPPQVINGNGEQYAMTTTTTLPTDGVQCDMACQTRDSLYAGGIISSKYSSTPPPPSQSRSSHSQPPSDTYKFSTFGYRPPSAGASSTQLSHHHPMYATMHHPSCVRDSRSDSVTHTIDITPTSTVIDNYEYINSGSSGGGGGGETILPPPLSHGTTMPTIHAAHGRHPYAHAQPPRKMEESCLMLEIRNSAPDVIIMTSH